MSETARRDALEESLATVRARIATACESAARAPETVTLVVVTKFFPASDVRLLAELGVQDVGESRHQEAAAKVAECGGLGLRWHFVGGLQSNKAAAVAAYSHVVESVDRPKLVGPLARGAEARGIRLAVLLQVSLDPPGASSRAGIAPEALLDLAARVAQEPHLRLDGLMAVAPRDEDPADAFARLAGLHRELLVAHPQAGVLSAGMSGDLEEAVAAGATHVRVGSAVLGSRPPVQ